MNLKLKFTSLVSTFVFLLFISQNAYSQAINEGFTNVATLFSTGGWAQQNLSTPIGTNPNWVQGNVTVNVANSSPDSSYIAANFNSVAGTATISNWLFTPTRTFNNGDIISFYTYSEGTYADNLQVRFSANGASVNVGTTNTSVGDFSTLLLEINPTLIAANYPSVWTQYSLTISGLAGPTTGRIAFRYFVTNGGPTGANSNYIGIDDYIYTPNGAGAPEVSITKVTPGEYTLVPQSQLPASLPISATIANGGTGTANTVSVNTRVFKLPNVATPVYNQTATANNLAAGASTTLNLPSFTPVAPTTGDYIFVSVINGNTGSVANDTFRYGLSVTPNWYARDNGTAVQGIGAGATAVAIIGNVFDVTANTTLDSVLFFCYPGALGLNDTVQIRIASTVAGVPSNTGYIGQSAIYRFSVADTSGAVKTLPVTNLTGGALTLTPGRYLIGIEESFTGDNYGLQCSANIFTQNTVYANINNGTYSPLNTLLAGFNYTPIVRGFFRTSCTVTSTSSSTNATCTASNGTATVTPAGGTAPYTYSWSNGRTTQNNTGLSSGNYSVTATDASGCSATATVTVGSTSTAITTNTPTTTNSACGGATGSASVTPSNGTAPYVYNWSNGGNTQTISNVAAGTYSVSITDANGCAGSVSNIVVSNPNAPTANISASQNVLCNGGTSGSATAAGNGGTAPYTYTWSNGANAATANALAAGTYSVTVIDAASCRGIASVTITQPTALNVAANSAATANVACFGGNNGQAAVTATGGTAPYTYTWSNAANTIVINGLTAGVYTVTVNDANNCNGTVGVTITQPTTALTVNAAGDNITCNGANNGTASASVNGGTAPYTYTWSNGSTSSSLNALAAGTYTVTTTDANGCVASTNAVTISEPTALSSSATATDASSAAATDGAVNISVSGGTAPYTYTWSNGANTQNLAAVGVGTYSVTITDANGCTSNQSATVSSPTALDLNNANINISMFPNPAENNSVLTVSLLTSSDVNIQISNVVGQVVTTINDANVINGQYTINTSEFAAGVYMVRVSAGKESATYRLTKK
jgi:trimeric autotransporter adhesin